MALTSGFFNSVDDDRPYDAEQISSIFDGVIRDGVYETVGDRFRVTPGDGMSVYVGTGRAWFNHTWTVSDTKISLNVESAETGLNRIDTVILEVDHSEDIRANNIKVITGTPATNPEPPNLVHSTWYNQYPLANIQVNAGTAYLTDANITNRVGTSDCPFVIGVLEIMTIDQIVAQWSQEFLDWLSQNESEFRAWYEPFVAASESQYNTWYQSYTSSSENRFSDWYTAFTRDSKAAADAVVDDLDAFSVQSKARFEAWFANLQDQLDDDQAGHLQNEIDDINERIRGIGGITISRIDDIWDDIF